MSASVKQEIHVWTYDRGPTKRGRFLFRHARCVGCGDTVYHRADELAPQDYRCGVGRAAHEHAWVDEHIRELTCDGRMTTYATQGCLGCRETRTVKRYRTPLPVGSTIPQGGKNA